MTYLKLKLNKNNELLISYSKTNPTIAFTNNFRIYDDGQEYKFYDTYYTTNWFGYVGEHKYLLVLKENEFLKCCLMNNSDEYLEKHNDLILLNVSKINDESYSVKETNNKINIMINKKELFKNDEKLHRQIYSNNNELYDKIYNHGNNDYLYI